MFSSIDVDPQDTLKLARTESALWLDAQTTFLSQTSPVNSTARITPVVGGRWCFTDGSWKTNDKFSGQGWLSTLAGYDNLMGARNTRHSLSALHSEIESLIWAMECMRNLHQRNVTFATDCLQLVKKISEPEEWPAFTPYLEELKQLRSSFTYSAIIHIPRTENIKADGLARSARIQQAFVVHMDAALPVWFSESS